MSRDGSSRESRRRSHYRRARIAVVAVLLAVLLLYVEIDPAVAALDLDTQTLLKALHGVTAA